MNIINRPEKVRTFLAITAAILVSSCETYVEGETGTVGAEDPGMEVPRPVNTVFARAIIEPTDGHAAQGSILFSESSAQVNIVGELSGLSPGLHGLHIHEQGDCSAPDASSAGGHFDPDADSHGSPQADPENHHVGDLGNVSANLFGIAKIDYLDTEMTLDAMPASITGRAIIVHSETDNFFDQPSGDSGEPVGCGIIVPLASQSTSH